MALTLSKKAQGEFEIHPITNGMIRAVIVDITPLEKKQTEYGLKEVFRIVYESEMKKEDGTPYCIWSGNYTPSLNEKANIRKDLKKIRGRDVSAAEEDAFDIEAALMGLTVQMIIEHEEGREGGKVFTKIAYLGPNKGEALQPSGKYVRKQDRKEKPSGSGGSYRKTGDDESARDPWQRCKVHVGSCKGMDLGDLSEEQVKKLLENWLPQARTAQKTTADDRRLIAALTEVESALVEPASF